MPDQLAQIQEVFLLGLLLAGSDTLPFADEILKGEGMVNCSLFCDAEQAYRKRFIRASTGAFHVLAYTKSLDAPACPCLHPLPPALGAF
jgi:hypothetical protein